MGRETKKEMEERKKCVDKRTKIKDGYHTILQKELISHAMISMGGFFFSLYHLQLLCVEVFV